MSTEYFAGVIVGVVVVLVIFALVWKVSGSESLKGDYDERQMLIRGVGYKYALIANLLMLGAYTLSTPFIKDLPLYPGEVAFGILMISVIIYALYCIRKDAFFGVKHKSRTYIILLIFIVAVNGLGAGTRIIGHEWLTPDGHIEFGFFSNACCVIGFGIVLIAILARNAERRREELADEES